MIHYLETNLTWNKTDIKTIIPLSLTLICFITYWFIAQSESIKSKFYAENSPDAASVKHIFFTKFIGFLMMGIVPLIACVILLKNTSLTYYGLTINPSTTLFSIVWIVTLSVLVMPLAYLSGKKPKNFDNYPQIRAKHWTKKIFIINLLGWAIYLFGYEFLFRGVLLFPLSESIGIWPAITINVVIYSATHIPKGLDETIGAIPLGFVLCVLTLLSGTIWIAFLVHVVLAWTNSLTALKFHPEIKYYKWGKK